MDNHQELLLSLVEKTIRVIPLDKDEWEARGGLNGHGHDDKDDSVTVATTVTAASEIALADRKENANSSSPHGSGSTIDDPHPIVFPTTSHLRKACLTAPPPNTSSGQVAPLPPPPSTSPTSRNRKANRKTLIAALEKWVSSNHSKAQKGKAWPCVKVLSNSHSRSNTNLANLKEQKAGTDGDLKKDPQALLDAYVRAERAKQESSFHDKTRKPPGNMTCPLYTERDASRSLLLRCNNTLLDGEVFSSNSAHALQSSYSIGSTKGADSSPSRTAILRCAASMYYRIWYFRTIRRKDVRKAYGFAVASSASGTGSKARVSMRISFLMLEKPSDSALNSPSIGGRWRLYVYKKRYDLPRDKESSRDSFRDNKPTSSSSISSSSAPVFSSTILDELAEFLYKQTESLPCPYKDTPHLSGVRSCPGGMLLPDEPLLYENTNGNSQRSARSASTAISRASSTRSSSSASAIPMHLEGCRIIPTITGSLVIHCKDALAVRELLDRSGPEEEGDQEGLRELIRSFASVASNSHKGTSWYVKYKTPSFGPVWGNSKMAINGPRGSVLKQHSRKSTVSSRDLRRSKTTSSSSSSSSSSLDVRRWMFLHPIDSWVGKYRTITITRSAGVDFFRAVDDYGMSWPSFQREFLGLAKSTIELQRSFNSLVHGDIHEGNVLYYPPFHNEDEQPSSNGESEHKSSKKSSSIGNQSMFPAGRRLVLIDWDEANRPKPFRRNADTAEERLRYPESLLDFPKQYTQQQLMHLFAKLAEKYYPNETDKIIKGDNDEDPDSEWMRAILVPPPPPPASSRAPFYESSFAKFLSRSAVEQRFKAMLRGLQGECWWSMNWGESGLDDGSYHIPKGGSLHNPPTRQRKSTRW